MMWLLVACSSPDPASTEVPTSAPTSVPTPVNDTGDTGAAPVPYDPGSVGPFAVDTSWIDAGPLALRAFRPVDAPPAPVVVLLHGFQLPPIQYRSYGEHLASHGYLVLTPQMPGSIFAPTPHAQLSVRVGELLDWVDQEPAELGSIQAGSLILAGHSLGGKIAALRASEDDRPDALFLIDPVDAGPPLFSNPVDYPSVTPERMGQIDVPILAFGETVNAGGFQPCAPAAENFARYVEHAVSPALAVEVVGADHMSWLDDPSCGLACDACPDGPADPASVRARTRAALVAYADAVLRGSEQAGPWLDAQLTAGAQAGELVLSGPGWR